MGRPVISLISRDAHLLEKAVLRRTRSSQQATRRDPDDQWTSPQRELLSVQKVLRVIRQKKLFQGRIA